MKKAVLFSVLALTASVFADDGFVAAARKGDNMSQSQSNNQMMNQVVLTSARPESDNGWYIFADALYWHADVGNTDWASKGGTTGSKTAVADHHLDFKWNWGFKVGLGVNMDHDMWDSNISYTWFRTENSNAIGLSSEYTAMRENVPPNTTATTAKLKWDIHFSMFDWELGRWYYVSKNLALRPHVGVKGGWINQDRKQTASSKAGQVTTTEHAHLKNNFWGVGPSAGINTMWVLGNAGSAMDHRFSLFGDFAGALMYGRFHNPYEITRTVKNGTTTTSSTSTEVKDLDRNLATTMLQGIMGLSWDTPFNRGRNHFMMRVGYEFQYWFRQNQFMSASAVSADGLTNAMRYSDDLALQGLTIDFRFDF